MPDADTPKRTEVTARDAMLAGAPPPPQHTLPLPAVPLQDGDVAVSLVTSLRRLGLTLLAALGCLLLAACLLPPVIFRLRHGRGPLTAHQYHQNSRRLEGKTADEVKALLGEPHERRAETDGSERWYYWQDSYGFGYLGVAFGPDGRVTHTWI